MRQRGGEMEIAIVVVAFVLILLGCVFVFVPGVPGPLVAWCGPLVYFLFSGAEKSPPADVPAEIPADAAIVPAAFPDASAVPAADAETFALIGAGTLAAAAVLALLTIVFDFFSSWLGAKKYGATWRGGIGAFVGAIAGPILCSPLGGVAGSLLGLLVGPIVGAILGELLGRNTLRGSARAGWGTFVGAVAAMVVKLFYCLAIFVWLVAELFF